MTLSELIVKLQALEANDWGGAPVYLNDSHGNTLTISDTKALALKYAQPCVVLEYDDYE